MEGLFELKIKLKNACEFSIKTKNIPKISPDIPAIKILLRNEVFLV